MTSLRRLLHYVRPHLGSMSLAYLCMMALSLTSVIYVALAGPGLEYMFEGDLGVVLRAPSGELRTMWKLLPAPWIATLESMPATDTLWVLPVVIVVVAVIKGLTHTAQFFLLGRMSQRVLLSLRRDMFGAIVAQSPSFFTDRSHGDLLSRLNSDTILVEQAFFYGFGSLLRDTLAVLSLLVYLFASDAKLALITFITVPLAVLPIVRFTKWLKRVSKRGQAAQGELSSVSYEALAGIRVVQAFCAEEREQSRFGAASLRYYKQMLVSYFIRAARTPTMEILGMAAFAILIGLLAHHVRTAGADTAHYISFMGAIFFMYDPLKKLGKVTDYLAAGEAAAERIFEVVDLEPEIRDAPDAVELAPFSERVVFENVTFTYASNPDTPVLDQVDIELTAGSLVALVGPSGSGKTTAANLLPRFYDVPSGGGRITVDGVDIRGVTLESLRRQIGVVTQDTFLFNASIAENIAYGTRSATDEQIQSAARTAYAHEFIEKLENGYDTVIGERGVRLSGGQRQRIAIARAVLRDAPLLILDEATSSLDVEAERYVQEALDALMQGRTSLVIAHRLTTIRRADTIHVLKEGRIVESGRHPELLSAGGEYARLYEMQFRDDPEPASRPSLDETQPSSGS